jgi:hypothetical protein
MPKLLEIQVFLCHRNGGVGTVYHHGEELRCKHSTQVRPAPRVVRGSQRILLPVYHKTAVARRRKIGSKQHTRGSSTRAAPFQ